MKRIFILLCVFIMILSGCLSYENTIKKSKEDHMYFDKGMRFANNQTEVITSDMMYEVLSNRINIYTTSWLISLYELNDRRLSETENEIIKDFCESLSQEQIDNFELTDLINITKIISTTEDPSSYYELVISSLMRFYVPEKGGFIDYINEDEETNIIIGTNKALQIFQIIGYIPKEYIPVIDFNMNLLKDDSNFKIENENAMRNIFHVGMTIMTNTIYIADLTGLDYSYQIEARKEWMNKWANYFIDFVDKLDVNNDYIVLTGTETFNRVYLYLGEPLLDVKSYIYNLDMTNETISKELYADIQNVYMKKHISSIYGINTTENFNYIKDNTKFLIYIPIVFPSISDIYYGVSFADKVEYSFDSDKIENYIINSLRNTIISVQDIYHIINIDELLGSEISFDYKDELFSLDQDTVLDFNTQSIECIYYYLFALDNMNSLSTINREEIISKTIQYFQNSVQDYEIYFCLKALELLDHKIEANIVIDKVKSYYSDNGGFMNEVENGVVNTYSTYYFMSIYSDYKLILSKEEIEELKVYLDSTKGQYGGYFISEVIESGDINHEEYLLNYDNNFTMKSCYMGSIIESLLREY